MSGRIRRAILSIGGAVSGLVNVDFNDAYEFDRTQGDNEMSGEPVEMKRQGSGTIELLAGNIASGYQTSDLIVTYYEVTVTAGVEAIVAKTVTFDKVTTNEGASLPSEGRGSRRIAFDYATSTTA